MICSPWNFNFKSIPDTVCGFYQRFVCMDIGDCTLTSAYMYVCLEKNMCISSVNCAGAYVHMYVFTCYCTEIRGILYTCTKICIYIYVYNQVHMFNYIYIYIYDTFVHNLSGTCAQI